MACKRSRPPCDPSNDPHPKYAKHMPYQSKDGAVFEHCQDWKHVSPYLGPPLSTFAVQEEGEGTTLIYLCESCARLIFQKDKPRVQCVTCACNESVQDRDGVLVCIRCFPPRDESCKCKTHPAITADFGYPREKDLKPMCKECALPVFKQEGKEEKNTGDGIACVTCSSSENLSIIHSGELVCVSCNPEHDEGDHTSEDPDVDTDEENAEDPDVDTDEDSDKNNDNDRDEDSDPDDVFCQTCAPGCPDAYGNRPNQKADAQFYMKMQPKHVPKYMARFGADGYRVCLECVSDNIDDVRSKWLQCFHCNNSKLRVIDNEPVCLECDPEMENC
jgi:hypothetical protein